LVFFLVPALYEKIIREIRAALKVEIRWNLVAGCFALWDGTYLYDQTKSPAEAILDGALKGF
jgi:hypothetical protein